VSLKRSGSELEGGLHKAAKHVVGGVVLTVRVVDPTNLTTVVVDVVQSRGDGDVVGHLELVPPLPHVVGVEIPGDPSDPTIVTTAILGDERRLTNGHSQIVTLHESVRPLQTDVPGVGLR